MSATTKAPQCSHPRHGHVRAEGQGYDVLCPIPCGTWRCNVCGPKKAYKLRLRIEQTRPTRLLTLTHKPQQGETPADALRTMRHHWAILTRRLNRREADTSIKYIAVVEWTKAGWPHIHCLIESSYVPQKWLSQAWATIHGAPIVDIRRVKPGKGAAHYIAKYLTKNTHMPKRMRLWSCTRGYLPVLPPYKSPDYEDELTWGYQPTRFMSALYALEAQNYTLIQGPGSGIIAIPPLARTASRAVLSAGSTSPPPPG